MQDVLSHLRAKTLMRVLDDLHRSYYLHQHDADALDIINGLIGRTELTLAELTMPPEMKAWMSMTPEQRRAVDSMTPQQKRAMMTVAE